ncbi:MAG: matrixin family metalloprotease [bacterium]|nr:matrixin family metalloprotease [bacterium]
MNRLIKFYLCLILTGLIGIPFFAYSYAYHTYNGNKRTWNTNNPRLRASNVTFSSGDPARTVLDDAISGLNDNPSHFSINLTHGENGVGLHNLQNEIWASDSGVLDGAPAAAFSKYLFSRIVAVDVVIDPHRTWTMSTNKNTMSEYGGSGRPLRNVIYHEVGHLFGLAHENDEYNVMGEDWSHIITNGDQTTSYFGEDAADGAIYLYGKGSGEDVSVTHWRWTGRNGEYSTHGRTRVFDTSGSRLSRNWINSEPHYRVGNGQTIQVEFSYENNGANKQNSIQVGYYLSTNSLITTHDTRLGGASINLARNNVWTTKHTITLPSNLPPNHNYWIGAVIDENDSIGEFDESNNATYIGLRTKNYTLPTPTPRPTDTPTPTPQPSPTPIDINPTLVRPTPTFGGIPTFRPTAFPTIPGFKTPLPNPTIPNFPTIYPTLPPNAGIHLPPDLIELTLPSRFEHKSMALEKASTLISIDPENPFVHAPEFILNGLNPLPSSHSLTLPNGAVLSTAIRSEDSSNVLVLITPDGDIREFANLNLKSFEINGTNFEVSRSSIFGMSFDGDRKLVLFIQANGSMNGDESGSQNELIIKTELTGPFENAAVDDFPMY